MAKLHHTKPVIEQDEGPGEGAGPGDDVAALCQEVLPTWAGQVTEARTQTEEAITDLAQRFSRLVERLRVAVEAARQASGDAARSSSSGDGADGVTAIMRKALADNQEVVSQVLGLASVTREMDAMIEVIKDVARQTDLIALNASIEAARAGEAGKSFAVVAAEVRRLAQEARSAGQLVGDKITSIGETVAQSGEQIRRSAASIEAALMGLSGMSQASMHLQAESAGIQAEISDMIVSLQFQDRVCQILAALSKNMDELRDVLAARQGGEGLDSESFLKKMRSAYTTIEQHRIHGAEVDDGASEPGDLVFF